jgi:two-component system response regulator ResD
VGQAKTILVVDDEERIRKLLKMFLEREEFRVLEAEHGEQALEVLAQEQVDLVVLDLMMPVLDGWITCEKIRTNWNIPVILLTARGEEADRVLGFELGADDYVVKPFSHREMVLRIKALLRRSNGLAPGANPGGDSITVPGLVIQAESRKVIIEGHEVNLTPLEFDLLSYLAKQQGRVFTREQLLQNVWGYDYFGDLRTVDTHIKRLREKLAKDSAQVAEYIATVWGVGYKFEVKQK